MSKNKVTNEIVEAYLEENKLVARNVNYNIDALVDFLNSNGDYSLDDITEIGSGNYDLGFTVSFGRAEYVIATEDEATEMANESIKSIYEDMGLESFSPNFQETIIEDYLSNDATKWFDEAKYESYQSYAEDIKSERDRDYGSRLVREMIDADLMDEDDFTDEDGNFDKDSAQTYAEDNIQKFIDYKDEEYDDSIEWYKDSYGNDDFARLIKNEGDGWIDMEAVCEAAIRLDGLAHFIATYDHEEITVNRNYSAYRLN